VSLRITYTGRQKHRDPDSMWKSLLDGLVIARLLVDDKPDYCEVGCVDQKHDRYESTTVILADIHE
jgi:hypothetical protein